MGLSSSDWLTAPGVSTSSALGSAFGSTEQIGFPAAMAAAVHSPNWYGCAVAAKLRARSGLNPS